MPTSVAAPASPDVLLDVYGQEPDREFTVGVIGAGDIAATAHLPTLSALRCARLAWVADIDAERCGRLGRAYRVPAKVIRPGAFEIPPADVVLLATPYGVREPYYQALRHRGCAVYAEKPFARTAEEHQRICSWYPPQCLTAGLMMRCWGANLMARDLVSSRLFGPLRAVRFGFGRPGLVTHGRYYFESHKGGGGLVAEVGIHGVDSALFVTRAVSARVDAVRVVRDGELDLHTDARLALRDESGLEIPCRITVTVLEETHQGMRLDFDHAVVSYLLLGQGFALHGDEIDHSVTVQPRTAARSYTLQPAGQRLTPGSKFQMFYDHWRRFLVGVHTGEANWTSAASALLTTESLQAIAEAPPS